MTFHDMVTRAILLLLVTVLLGGCTPDPQYQVVEPPLVPFEELFVLEDTISLDPSVIIGRISFMDISTEGNLLITDGISDSVFLFSPTGEHIRSYDPLKCLIGREKFHPWNSLFMNEGKIMTTQRLIRMQWCSIPMGVVSVQCNTHPHPIGIPAHIR